MMNPVPKVDIFYVCDGFACGPGGCPNPECHHTNDIRHAKNFLLYIVTMTVDDTPMAGGENAYKNSYWESHPDLFKETEVLDESPGGGGVDATE